jgi:hypothetical protein
VLAGGQAANKDLVGVLSLVSIARPGFYKKFSMVVTIHMMDIDFFEFLDFSLRKIPVQNFLYRTPGTHLLLNNLNIFDPKLSGLEL